MKKFKLTAIAAAAAIGCSLIPQFAAVADNPASADHVLMVYDFEDGQKPDTSGNLSAEIVSSPMGGSFVDIKTDDAYNALLEADKANNVLKLSAADTNEENAVTLYDGTLPEAFAFDFSVFRQDADPNFEITVKQGDVYSLIKFDGLKMFFKSDKNFSLFKGNIFSTWTPYTMIFSNFASDNTKLTMYCQGKLNYTYDQNSAKYVYNTAYLDLGDYYNGLNLDEPVQIILKKSDTEDVYFDNFRLYRYENEITNEAGSDFEADTVGMLPMQNGIRTGGSVSKTTYSSNSSTKNFGAIRFQTIVEKDPKNSENKVLKSTRGQGGDIKDCDSAVRYTVKKPKEKLEISFKALISAPNGFDEQQYAWDKSRKYDLTVDIADGTFTDIFYSNETQTPADRILTFEDTGKPEDGYVGKVKSSGKYLWPVKTAADDFNWKFGEWSDVAITYDVQNNETEIVINNESVKFTPGNDTLQTIMGSDEDTITIAILKVANVGNMLNNYIMLDDVSIKSDGGNKEPEPTPTPTAEPTPTPTATPDIGQSERKEVVTAAYSSHAGYFWDVAVNLSHNSFKGVFTSATDEKTLEKTFEIGNMQGGDAVFSVILLDAPEDVKAKFTVE